MQAFHIFEGEGEITPRDVPWQAPDPVGRKSLTDPAGYMAGRDLRNAVNVALALGMPLLLTGEPGTGKTQLAFRLSHELGLGDPLRFDARSSSVAADLFYRFDSVRHFAEAQAASVNGTAQPDKRRFIRYEALGAAILRTLEQGEAARLASGSESHRIQLGTPRASVVLIDEIDKAPRDFPNDLLSAVEEYRFDIPEMGRSGLCADMAFKPIIVITSNSEKQLPEAFLRRCIYHHIEFPSDKEARLAWIESILSERFRRHAEVAKLPGYAGVLDLFLALRDQPGMEKRPSTSELLDCLQALALAGFDWAKSLDGTELPNSLQALALAGYDWVKLLGGQRSAARVCLNTLLKTEADRRLAQARLPELGKLARLGCIEEIELFLSKRFRRHANVVKMPGYAGVLDLFFALNDQSGIEKKPTRSELLDCLLELERTGFDWVNPLDRQRSAAHVCLNALVKTEADRRLAQARLPALGSLG